MINDEELKTSQQRIVRFQRWLAQMRQTARTEGFDAVTSGYRLEIERMQAEVMDYLLQPAKAAPAEQAA